MVSKDRAIDKFVTKRNILYSANYWALKAAFWLRCVVFCLYISFSEEHFIWKTSEKEPTWQI
jgi:hypothetical protein